MLARVLVRRRERARDLLGNGSRRGAGHRPRLDAAPTPPHEQFRRRADESAVGVDEAAGLLCTQPAQDGAHVEVGIGVDRDLACQYDLLDPVLGDRREGPARRRRPTTPGPGRRGRCSRVGSAAGGGTGTARGPTRVTQVRPSEVATYNGGGHEHGRGCVGSEGQGADRDRARAGKDDVVVGVDLEQRLRRPLGRNDGRDATRHQRVATADPREAVRAERVERIVDRIDLARDGTQPG